MAESVIVSDSLALNTSRDAHVGTWWFETVIQGIVGTEWDPGPALFTKILNDCRERLQPTLNKSSIFSYACREHSTVLVATGQVAIEGFLKMRGTDKVRLGTLRRRLQHDSIIGDINWIPIEVGRGKRYTADERIQNFLEQTALPPSGVLQSSSSVRPRLRRSPRAERHPGRRWRPSHNSAAGSGRGRDWRGRSGLQNSCSQAANMPATAAAAAVAQARGNTSRHHRRSSSP